MYFDSSGEDNTVTFSEYAYPGPLNIVGTGQKVHDIDLPGANRDWDSDSLYLREDGQPIIYTVESAEGQNGVLYQLSARGMQAMQASPQLSVGMVNGIYKHTPKENQWHEGTLIGEGELYR